MALVTLIEARPRGAAGGGQVDVRLAGGGSRAYIGHRGFLDWRSGAMSKPRFSASLGFDEGGWTGNTTPQSATLAIGTNDTGYLSYLAGLYWIGAPIEIYAGDDAAAVPTWTRRLKGVVAAVEVGSPFLRVTVSDLSTALDRPFAPDTFAGNGGLEGDVEATGRTKRRSLGQCWNVEGRVLDKVNNVYEFGDPFRPLRAFLNLKDKGRGGPAAILGWQGTAIATLNALRSSTPPAGGSILAPSIACVKWWTTPAGPLTCDLEGETPPFGYTSTPAGMTRYILEQAGFGLADFGAADQLRLINCGTHIGDNSTTAAQVIDRVLLGTSLNWSIDANGLAVIREWAWGASAETIRSEGVTRDATYRPTRARRVGYQANNRIHSDSEVSAALLLAGIDTDATRNDDGGNMIDAPGDNSQWLYYNGARPASIGTDRLAAAQAAQLAFGDFATVVYGSRMYPVSAGETLWFQHVATTDGPLPGGQTIRGGLQIYDAAGNPVAPGSIDVPGSAIGGSEANGVWVARAGEVTVPAGVAKVRPYSIRAGAPWTAYSAYVGEPVLSRSQPGADVTGLNVSAGFDGQGGLATANTADFSTQVSGATKPSNNADVTSANTAAAITGQAATATDSNISNIDTGTGGGSYTDGTGYTRQLIAELSVSLAPGERGLLVFVGLGNINASANGQLSGVVGGWDLEINGLPYLNGVYATAGSDDGTSAAANGSFTGGFRAQSGTYRLYASASANGGQSPRSVSLDTSGEITVLKLRY